ncbi:LysR family transcriptional regulator [Chromobacterium vaccinii]|uniref:LysR family transcriptional regulator n=1 Tax=Chromobacterium vaccinii TaxID=1108595 RepID=UPI00345AF37A
MPERDGLSAEGVSEQAGASRLPSLRLLAGFEAAARIGSFSRAAESLHLSQSAISHQIQQLEEFVGQPLFHRVGRGVELTFAGEMLQQSVGRALETLRRGLDRIAVYTDPGLVALVGPAFLLQGWLQPRLSALRAAHPDIVPLLSIDEEPGQADEIDVDLLISPRPMSLDGWEDARWLRDEWLFVCAPALAEELAGLPLERHHELARLVCLERARLPDAAEAETQRLLRRFGVAAIYDDAQLARDAALRGHGIPRWLWTRICARDGCMRWPATSGCPARNGGCRGRRAPCGPTRWSGCTRGSALPRGRGLPAQLARTESQQLAA